MKPILLVIMDGFGLRDEAHGNAIKLANTKNLDKLKEEYPHTKLIASGLEVGLPKNQMGNSETGHLNIGSGRVVYQPLEFINNKIEDKTFFKNKQLLKIMQKVKKNNSALHIFGLLSDGGIHSHINHIFALIDMLEQFNLEKVYIHAILDGRDTSCTSSVKYLNMLNDKIKDKPNVFLSDICGRYYAMDREKMWDLTEKYYNLVVNGQAQITDNYQEYIENLYKENITDEFIPPTIIKQSSFIKENDGIIMANFRPDRITQTFTAITNKKFDKFPTKKFKNVKLVTMMPVEKQVIAQNAYPHIIVKNTLTEYLSKHHKKVLKIAETSKYPHVTYFFDGGKDLNLKNVDKIIVPRKEVKTYDLAPRMSADEITKTVIPLLQDYDLIVLNYANCDMVGHTGKLEETKQAVEAVDENIGLLYEAIKKLNGTLIITADHGNAELMLDENNNVVTTHTTNEVPFIITDKKYVLKSGSLKNIAPTILKIMNLKIPKEMSKETLI